MSEPLMTAQGIRKSYRMGQRTVQVLNGADFELRSGESVSIRGESGSGKSTFLHLLAGLDRPDAGEVRWEGKSELSPLRRGKFVGLVFQAFHLVPELDARDNILLARRIVGPIDAGARRRAEELLERVGLKDRASHLPNQLSGGERQRVAVARALVNRPPVLLADEPTGNLDEHTGDEVIAMLLELCAGTNTALVLVTHNPEYAARAARSLLLHEGVLRPAS